MTRTRRLRPVCLGLGVLWSLGCGGTVRDSTQEVPLPLPPATGEVLSTLHHPSFDWDSTRTEHFAIYTQPGSYASSGVDSLCLQAEEAVGRALEVLQEDGYPQAIRLFMLDSRDQMESLIGMHVKGISLFEDHGILMVYNQNVRPYLRHEVFHSVSIGLWGMPDTWVREGSAVFADGECLGYTLEQLGAYLVESGKAVDLPRLVDEFDRSADMITYLESAGLFRFIYQNYDIDRLKAFWQGGSGSAEETLGTTLEELQWAWEVELERLDPEISNVDWSDLLDRGCG